MLNEPKLNWYCKECKRLKNGCNGSTDSVYSNCVSRKHWLDNGNKVKVINTRRVGTIQRWDWVTNYYFIKFDDGRILPYKRNDLKEVHSN